MAQLNFLYDDDGRVLTGINGNTTSAITAGDILYASPPSTSPFGTTAPQRAGSVWDEVEVEPVKFATALTQGKWTVGVALHDAAAGSQVAFATEGIFAGEALDSTGFVRAGTLLRAAEGTTNVVTNAATTSLGSTAEASNALMCKCGYALTSANSDGHYILWKFSK